MSVLTFRCMKAVVESGGRRYPLFMGFLAAEEIRRIASAPSFRPSTNHRDIAANILEPPVEDWQRPLDDDRLRTIHRVFDNSGALMPNPVLLSANGIHEAAVRIEQERADNAIPTDIWAVRVDEPEEGQPPPLWILDGQHRIYGLAESRQKANLVPVVLLLNDGGDRSYSASDFAELFAQVTTTARKLEPLHNEWLTYSFDLEAYANAEPDQAEHKQAMRAVAELCKQSNLANDVPNPFANGIRFNPENSYVKTGGFSYSCIDLKELVRKHYYAQESSPLPATDLAEQIAQAYLALKEVVRAPHEETVFFGAGDFGQLPMQDAFVIGVLAYLRERGAPDSWRTVLTDLHFDETDWNFRTWVGSLSGRAGNVSRQVSQRFFSAIFAEGRTPEGLSNLADHLKGNRAQLTLVFSYVSEAGRPRRRNRQEVELSRGDTISHAAGDHLHVRVAPLASTSNIGRLDVVDARSRPGAAIRYQAIARGGMLLGDLGDGRAELIFHMEHYGGLASEAEIAITW